MTRISFIALASIVVGFVTFTQGASAATKSEAQMTKYCAQMGNQDSTACRDFVRIRYQRLLTLISDDNGGGGKGGRGARGGQK